MQRNLGGKAVSLVKSPELDHDFRSGMDIWEGINVTDNRVQRELMYRGRNLISG